MTVINIRDHDGKELPAKEFALEEFSLFISEEMLQACPGSKHGEFLLRLLKMIDYAGSFSKPVMLYGRKQKTLRAGFQLTVIASVPDVSKQSLATDSDNGTTRVG